MRRLPLALLAGALLPATLLGQLFGPEFAVNTTTASAQVNPAVAGNAAGTFVVAWTSGVYPVSNVNARRFGSDGAPVGGDFRVNTYSTGLQYSPAAAMNPAGEFVIAWNANEGQSQIWAQRYAGAGAPLGVAFRVDDSADSAYVPRVVYDAGGRFVVAWHAMPANKIMARRYDGSGAPLGGAFQVNTTAGERPDVAPTASGFVVAWSSNFVDPGLQYGRSYASSGAALGGEFPISTAVGAPGNHVVPRVAGETGGGFSAAWVTNVGADGQDVLGRRFDSSAAPLGPVFQVELQPAAPTGNLATLDLASDAGGTLLAWTQQVGSRQEIRARQLPGGEFRVNTYTTGTKGSPAVAALAPGRFVVVWHSVGQDGSSYGIVGQRVSFARSGDANGDGATNVSDVFYLINFLFAGGPPPFVLPAPAEAL